MNRRRAYGSAAIGLALAGLGTAADADWEVVPEAAIVALTDDNIRLLPESAGLHTSSAMSLDMKLRISTLGERGGFYFDPRVRIDEYADQADEDLNGTDTFLRTYGERSWERATLGFLFDYDLQDVRDAELADATPDDPNIDLPPDADTGIAVVDDERERRVFAPYAEITLSERSDLVLEAQIFEIAYENAQFARRMDFVDTQFAAGIVRRVDERNEVSARLVGGEYSADFNQNNTRTFGVLGAFSRPLSRNWTFGLTAGVSRSDYTFVDEQGQVVVNADTYFTPGLSFRQRPERNTINIDVSQEADPNSGGFLTVRDQLWVYLSRAMSERLTGEIGLRGYSSTSLDDVVADDDRDYFQLDLRLEWFMTERMSVSGTYTYTTQKVQDFSANDATSNAIYFAFGYRGLSSR
jgi:hypothetical protein